MDRLYCCSIVLVNVRFWCCPWREAYSVFQLSFRRFNTQRRLYGAGWSCPKFRWASRLSFTSRTANYKTHAMFAVYWKNVTLLSFIAACRTVWFEQNEKISTTFYNMIFMLINCYWLQWIIDVLNSSHYMACAYKISHRFRWCWCNGVVQWGRLHVRHLKVTQHLTSSRS